MSTIQDSFIATVADYAKPRPISEKLDPMFGGPSVIAPLIWEARRQGAFDGALTWAVADYLTHDANLFDADDFVSLLDDFATTYPDGLAPIDCGADTTTRRILWPNRGLEGWADLFDDLFEAKTALDPSFPEAVAERRARVSEPVGTGLTYRLAHLGIVPVDALPEGLLDALVHSKAQIDAEYGGYSYDTTYLDRYDPWSEEEWIEASERVFLAPTVDAFKCAARLEGILPELSDTAIVSTLLKLRPYDDETKLVVGVADLLAVLHRTGRVIGQNRPGERRGLGEAGGRRCR